MKLLSAVLLPTVILCVALPAGAADSIDIPRTLAGVEDRYNHTQTLQLGFTETYRVQGRVRVEKGELFLRKPGRMRWRQNLILRRMAGESLEIPKTDAEIPTQADSDTAPSDADTTQ